MVGNPTDGTKLDDADSLPEFVRPREAARALRVTQRTILRWLEDGVLPGVKLGGVWRLERAALERRLALAGEEVDG